MRKHKKLLFILPAIGLLLLMSSCYTKPPLPTAEQRDEARKQVPCLVILPVETQLSNDPAITYQKAAELEEGAAFMDKVITEKLVGQNHVRVLSARQYTSLIPEDSSAQLTLVKKIGSVVKCDAVMLTTLSRYRQRVGGKYGADSPASVLFSMKLYETKEGRVLWSAMFDETQQSVLSNIMSLGSDSSRGFTWLTAEELVSLGINEKLKECPYLF